MIDFKCGSPERHLIEKISQIWMTSLVSSVQLQHSALSSLQDPLPAMFAASTISALHTYNMNINT